MYIATVGREEVRRSESNFVNIFLLNVRSSVWSEGGGGFVSRTNKSANGRRRFLEVFRFVRKGSWVRDWGSHRNSFRRMSVRQGF